MFQTNRNRDGLLFAATNGGLFGLPGSTTNLDNVLSDYLNIDAVRSNGRNVILVIASGFNAAQVSQPVLTRLLARQPPITIVTVGNDNSVSANTVGNAFRFQIPLTSYTPQPLQGTQTVNNILSRFPFICRGQAPVPTG